MLQTSIAIDRLHMMKLEGLPRDKQLLFAGFNQDQACFACGLDSGFSVYNCDPLKHKEKHELGGSIRLVEMLFRCNYIAVVGGGTNPAYPRNKVMLWDDVRKAVCIELDFETDVVCVRLRRDRIVVVLERSIQVFTFSNHPKQLHVFETHQNSAGLCCLCPSSQNSILAFGATTKGAVAVVDLAKTDCPPLVINAHESAIACISLNMDGTRLGTASQKGTLIRVFHTLSGQIISQLRRGSNPATIYCINFSQDSTLLCASSNHATVHIFSLVERNNHGAQSKLVPKYFDCVQSFCKIDLPSSSVSICAFAADATSVIVVCADGSFYKFLFNGKGQCTRQTYAMFLELSS